MASWNCSGAQSGIAKFSKWDGGLRKNKSFVKDIVEAQRQVHPGRNPEGHSLSSERRGRSKDMLVLTCPHSLFFECLISSSCPSCPCWTCFYPFNLPLLQSGTTPSGCPTGPAVECWDHLEADKGHREWHMISAQRHLNSLFTCTNWRGHMVERMTLWCGRLSEDSNACAFAASGLFECQSGGGDQRGWA